MKLLVTGGAGYIGSVVCAYLIEQGHKVVVVDNLSRGHHSALHPESQLIVADVNDIGGIISRDEAFDAVVHLAAYAYVGESMSKPEIYWRNNVEATISLMNTMYQLNIPKLVFASSCAAYGVPKSVPITETTTSEPVNTYGRTKLAADMAIKSYVDAGRISATSLRFFNVAGAYGAFGEKHQPETHIIPLAFASAVNGLPFTLFGDDYPTKDGTCIRDYIHVIDLARAILMSIENMQENTHEIYNLGNGEGYSNQEVISTVQEVTGRAIDVQVCPRRTGDPPALVASSEKVKQDIGWEPSVPSLKDIISDSWTFYQAAIDKTLTGSKA